MWRYWIILFSCIIHRTLSYIFEWIGNVWLTRFEKILNHVLFLFYQFFGIVSLFSVIFALFAHFFPLACLFLYSHLYFILFLAWFDWVLSFSTFIKPINTMVYGDATLVICDAFSMVNSIVCLCVCSVLPWWLMELSTWWKLMDSNSNWQMAFQLSFIAHEWLYREIDRFIIFHSPSPPPLLRIINIQF